ncbi:g protein-coupled receptor [Anaeramoeba ignava]|uniref:G protein-coupled receptor n=1 Tax=Anaeramoeba ignava TaxID=1746090 RepID=A0A9Q0LTW9_ANAIG|nr:g protein-coupled receptor [Anaeramoeba ignava]
MLSKEDISSIIGASLGMIGALLIIIIYYKFKEFKNFYRNLIFILSVYDFFQSISYLLPGHSNKIVCRIQCEMLGAFALTSQFWSASISILSYLKIYRGIDEQKLNKIQKWFHLIMWLIVIGFIIFSAVLPTPNNSKTYWCATVEEVFLITFYSFLWFFLITCLIFYILIVFRLRKTMKLILGQYHTTKIRQMNEVWIEFRMSFIPLIYILIFIPATIRRIRSFVHSSASEIESINILQGLLSSSQGFWDFWIFVVFDPKIRKKLKIFCCRYKSEDEFKMEISKLDQKDAGNISIHSFIKDGSKNKILQSLVEVEVDDESESDSYD